MAAQSPLVRAFSLTRLDVPFPAGWSEARALERSAGNAAVEKAPGVGAGAAGLEQPAKSTTEAAASASTPKPVRPVDNPLPPLSARGMRSELTRAGTTDWTDRT
jgi:hypothetical protein